MLLKNFKLKIWFLFLLFFFILSFIYFYSLKKREPLGLRKEKKYVLMTIDVEALKGRANKNHVDKLIYGRFDKHPSAGILDMMEIANRAKGKLNFFIDFCEEGFYGIDTLKKITMAILSLGHDVQGHCHPSTLGKVFWKEALNRRPFEAQNLYDEKTAHTVISKFKKIINEIKSSLPEERRSRFKVIAYRGGSFKYNDEILKSLAKNNFNITTNYSNISLYNNSFKSQVRKYLNLAKDFLVNKQKTYPHTKIGTKIEPFYWINEEKEKISLELPVIGQMDSISRITYMSLNGKNSSEAITKSTKNYSNFWQDMQEMPSPIITIIFHSWSFLCHKSSSYCNMEGNNTNHFLHGKPEVVEEKKNHLYSFLKNKPDNFEFITIQKMDELIKEGIIKIENQEFLEQAKYKKIIE